MPTAQEIYDQQLLQDDPFDYNKAMDEYKGGRKPLLDAIMSNYKKPEPQIDPEQEKKAKYGAALSDTFGSLAQMFAHGQGARVQRNQGASSTEKTNARLQAIRDKYEQDLTQYQTIKGNAAVQDLNMHLASAKEASGKKRQYLLYRAKQAAEEAENDKKRQQQVEDNKLKREQQKEDLSTKFNQSKELAMLKAGLVKKRSTSTPTRSGTKAAINPADAVEANIQAEQIDKEWLVKTGYMKKQTKADPKTRKPTTTYVWDAKATPAIKKELATRYAKEQQARKRTKDPLGLGL